MTSVLGAILPEADTYTVSRPSAGTRTDGVYTPGTPSSVSVTMAVEPMTGRQAQYLPEGIRSRQLVRCYATTELKGPDRSTATMGDRFTYLGEVYEVVDLEDRERHGGYWKAIAAKVED